MSNVLAKRALVAHPDAPTVAGIELEAAIIERAPGTWVAQYVLMGPLDAIGAVVLPRRAAPLRSDGLWQSTCFELFVAEEGEGYREYNFAPDGRWAAYRFDSYREGMAMDRVATIASSSFVGRSAYVLTVELPVPLPGVQIGLSAVIEAKGGSKSYWALAHPPGKPDFHHRDCFALQLPAAGGA